MGESENSWENCKTHVFWGEIAPCDHVVQIYEDDEAFLQSLETFVSGGINSNECVIIIATQIHLKLLDDRLKAQGFDIGALIKDEQYIPLNADMALEKFMRNGWPDEILFKEMVFELIGKARRKGRKIRAFGEMVAILWGKGHNGATVHLENLWNKICSTEAFLLFCAYPKSGFTQDAVTSIQHICNTHSKVIGGWNKSKTEIFYKKLTYNKQA